jgi:hypothetical protein
VEDAPEVEVLIHPKMKGPPSTIVTPHLSHNVCTHLYVSSLKGIESKYSEEVSQAIPEVEVVIYFIRERMR